MEKLIQIMKFTKKLRYLLLTVFVVIFMTSLFSLLNYFCNSYSENKMFTTLREEVNKSKNEKITDIKSVTLFPKILTKEFFQESSIIQEKYMSLYEQNSDLAGWIKINDTSIDYPVMFTPNNPQFYLRRAFDKSNTLSGTPFIGKGCTIKPISDNIIIYGHNMKNNTMFSDLLKYKDEKYCNEHSKVQFDTIFAQGNYEIIWAFYTDVSNDNNHFMFYKYQDLSGIKRKEFTDKCQELSIYKKTQKLNGDERFLTLVTCSYHSKNGRFVVIAKNIDM